MNFEYIGTEIDELSFEKNLNSSKQIELGAKTDYKVLYANDGTTCLVLYGVELASNENPKELKIRYRAKSLFKINNIELSEENKKIIHIEAFNRVFPMHNATVRSFAATVGLPDISIPDGDISDREIKFE